MLDVMRRWIARQLQPERRWALVAQLAPMAFFAFMLASNYIWPYRSPDSWKKDQRAAQELLDQAHRTEDPAEQQRLLKEVNARNTRGRTALTQEMAEQARVTVVRTRATGYAIAIMLTAMVPSVFVAFRERRRERWVKSGCCGKCGYDLRASLDRCPECGTEVLGAK
jgi:hypothetical protein